MFNIGDRVEYRSLKTPEYNKFAIVVTSYTKDHDYDGRGRFYGVRYDGTPNQIRYPITSMIHLLDTEADWVEDLI